LPLLFFTFLILTTTSAVLVAFMSRIGVLDIPDARKSHTRPIPKGGGVGIVAASLLSVIFLNGPIAPRVALALGGLLVATVGYWDDRHDFPPAIKFTAQLLAAILPVLCGLTPHWSGLFPLDAAVSIGWILLVTNAVNFMDGLNGLSAGATLIAAAATLAAGGFANLTIGLIAGVSGFLPFNYPRARVFMGDVGSQFCGYALALLALIAAGRPHPYLIPFALAGLLTDVVFTLIRRSLAGERITTAHRGHLYQIAQRSGVPAPLVALIHWAFAGWGAWLGVLSWHPWLLPALLAPQLCWALYVTIRARRHPVGRW
jgi:UDP-GlcNAc:undecaprenyl-phosphate GlcNAc-1-phosphate transferase